MIPIFVWVLVFIGVTACTFFSAMESYDNSRVKWTLIPLALIFFPFLLREKTIEISKGVSPVEVSAAGVPFITVEKEEDLQIVSLSNEFGRNIPAGTKVEVYTKIGKYVRFFGGEESVDLYRIVGEEQK
jgi:hypothetical protein